MLPTDFRTASLGFPPGSVGKEPTYSAGDIGGAGSIAGSGRSPGGGNDSPLQYGKFHGQRSMTGNSLWDRKSQT